MNKDTHLSAQLVLGALLFGVPAVLLPGAIPLRLVGLVLLVAGYMGLLDRLGLDRPLNRLSAVTAGLGAAACVGWLCLAPPQPALGVFGLSALLAAAFVTGIAVLHREGPVRRIGAVGAVGAGVPLLALLGGHLALGGYGLLGLAWGRAAISDGNPVTWPIEALIALLALAAAFTASRVPSASAP